jgi:hypothetical protein
MKKLTSFFVVMIFAVQAIVVYAQSTEKPEPRFTLTLSMGRHGGEFSKNTQVLLVTLTNTSKEVIDEGWCLAFHGMYNLNVMYNGVPVEDTDAQKKYKKSRESGRCSGSYAGGPTYPGKTKEEYFYFDTTKPGTYEFTVTRETFPWNPEKSVTVKSNTLTIVVPEPGTTSPQ